MITKKLIARLSIGLVLGVAALTTSGIASAHDNGHHREWRDHRDSGHHRGWRNHRDHGHRHNHWERRHYHPREVVRIYERDHYVVPSYNYRVDNRPRHNDGLTIIYRDSWR